LYTAPFESGPPGYRLSRACLTSNSIDNMLAPIPQLQAFAPNNAIFKPIDLCTTPHPCMSSTYRSTSSTLLKNKPAPQRHWQLDTGWPSTYLPSPCTAHRA
jgi:hypothetical protein